MSSQEIPKDFVYAGIRYLSVPKKKDLVKAVSLYPVNSVQDSRMLEEEMCLQWDREWERRVIGGSYRGAVFGTSEAGTSTIKGSASVTYISQWPDHQLVLQWQALSSKEVYEAQKRAELRKREKEGKETFYQDELLKLRGLYQSCRPYTRRAIEEAMQIALRTPLTKDEQATYDAWVAAKDLNASRRYAAKSRS